MPTITDDFNDTSKISSSTNLQVASGNLEPLNNANSGYIFDSTLTSYITIPSIFPNTADLSFSISCWIKTPTNGTRFIFDSIGSPANYFSFYTFNGTNGQNLRAETVMISGGTLTLSTSLANIVAFNELIHVACVRDGVNNLLMLFLNGSLVASVADSRAGTFYNTMSNYIGTRYSLGASNKWTGEIFDFKVWGATALTQLEMHQDYLGTLSTTPTRHYKLYSDLVDSGSDGQNGTNVNSLALGSTVQNYKKYNQVISTDLLSGAGSDSADTFKYTLARANA